MTQTLVFGGVLAIAAASLYAYVGTRFVGRRVEGDRDAEFALRLFGLWWLALAASTAIGAATNFFAALEILHLPLFVTTTYLNILLICTGLWALLYYLLYLFTGRRGILGPLSAFYIAYYVLLVYYITASTPVALEVRPWRTSIVYENPLTGPFFAIVLILLVVPQIAGAIAYFTLFFRLRDRTLRWRVSLVSWAIILWFSLTLIGAFAGLSELAWWHFVTRALGLMAAVMVLMAYYPPGWMRQRFGVARVEPSGSW